MKRFHFVVFIDRWNEMVVWNFSAVSLLNTVFFIVVHVFMKLNSQATWISLYPRRWISKHVIYTVFKLLNVLYWKAILLSFMFNCFKCPWENLSNINIHVHAVLIFPGTLYACKAVRYAAVFLWNYLYILFTGAFIDFWYHVSHVGYHFLTMCLGNFITCLL